MISTETSRLITVFLCIAFLFVFFQCTFSQPIETDVLNAHIKGDADGNGVDTIWIRPVSYVDSDELNSEENDSEESGRLLSKYRLLYEHDEHNRPSLSSPNRRANFWKRVNFWRKRANFW